jgi:hypothetical protein
MNEEEGVVTTPSGTKLRPLTPEQQSKLPVISSFPTVDTRSEQQKRNDARAKQEALQRWQQEDVGDRDAVYFKRNGQWQKAGSFFIPSGYMQTKEIPGKIAGDVASAVSNTFGFLYDRAGKPMLRAAGAVAEPVKEQIYRVPGVEISVGAAVDAAGFLGNKAYEHVAKPYIRNSMVGLITPLQLIENIFMFGQSMVTSGVSSTSQRAEASFLEQLTGIFTNTTLYYEFFNDEGVESTGLLPNPEIEARRAKDEERLRPTLFGQTATVGRIIGGLPVLFGWIETDDDIHQLISGGIDGLFNIFADPVNWIGVGAIKKVALLTDAPMAPTTARKVKELTKAGVILDEKTLAQADEILATLDESARLSDEAVDLLSPKPNILYSGDKHTPELVIQRWTDIDDPNFVINDGNLVGPGAYVSDSPILGSTYQKNKIGDAQIDGFDYGVPVLDETEGANRLYKFEKGDDLVVADSELPWTRDPEVAWNRTNFEKEFGYDKETFDEIVNILQELGFDVTGTNLGYRLTFESLYKKVFSDFDDFSLFDYFDGPVYGGSRPIQGEWPFAQNLLPGLSSSQYDDLLKNPNFSEKLAQSTRRRKNNLVTPGGNFVNKTKEFKPKSLDVFLTPEQVAQLDPSIVEAANKIVAKYDDIFAQTESRIGSIENRLLGRESVSPDEIGQLFRIWDEYAQLIEDTIQLNPAKLEGLFRNITNTSLSSSVKGKELSAYLKNALLSRVDVDQTALSPVKKTLSDGREVTIEVSTKGLSVAGDFGTKTLPPLGEAGKTNSQYLFNRWLAANGVDAVRYLGGRIRGGYGNHNAYAVFRPSKLKVIDATTGSTLPTNVAKGMVEAGEDLKVTAEQAMQAIGFRDAAGLVEGMRRSANPSQYLAWKQTGYAQNLFAAIAGQDSPSYIWLNVLKQRSPRLAGKLAAAKTADEVEAIFDLAVSSPDPFEHLFNLPGWNGNIVSEAGYRLKQWTNGRSRIAATLPQTGTLPLDDFAAGAKHLDDAMVIVRAAPETRTALMDEYIGIVTQSDPQKIRGDLFTFADKAKKAVITDRLKPLLDRLEAPLKKTIEEMTPLERLTMKNRRKIAEDLRSYINRNSRWATAGDEVTRWTLDDIGTGRKLAWVDGNGSGPLYPSQQNSQGFQILPFDPDELDRLVALTERWALLREQAKTVPGMYQAAQALDTMLRGQFGLFNANTLWKKVVLFAGRYIARVVPEEMTRVQFSGVFSPYEFSYVSEIVSGRLSPNLLGQVYPYLDEAGDIAADLASADALQSMINRALQRGDTKAAAKYERRLARIDAEGLQARLNEVESLLESEVASVKDVMIGPSTGKAADTVLGQNVPGYVKAGTQQVVSFGENPTLWRKFKAQMIIERSVNPVARAVADAMRTGSPGALDGVAARMLDTNDPLRKSFERYFGQQGNLRPGYVWDSTQGAADYVATIVDDLLQVADGHPTMLEAIAEGSVKIGDKKIGLGRRTAEGNIPSQEFLKLMENGDEGLAGVRPFSESVDPANMAAGYPKPDRKQAEVAQGAFSWFMRHAYGRASDKFARVPFWNARKWNLIADQVPMLSPEEAAKLRETLPSYGLPKRIEENILDNLRFAQGEATLKDLDMLAGYQATEDTINLLFDSRKRTLFGRNHRLLFPFFDAFREVSSQIMKTAINPLALHKVDKAVRGLENTSIGAPNNVDADGKREGFIYRDPTTKEMVWNVPLAGQAARALTGIPFNYKITVGSMSIATSVLPGIGPVASFTYTAIPNRTGETWDKINRYVIPFGEPSQDVRDYFTPMYLRRVSQGLAEGTPAQDFSRLLFGDPNQNDTYKMMVNRAFMAELSQGMITGLYTSDEESVREAMRVGQEKAQALWFMRGVTQFFAPAAPIAEYYYKTNKDLVPLGVLLDSMRETQNRVRSQGGSFEDQIDALITSYGDHVLPYLASVSENQVPGAEASKQFYNFKNQNQELFSAYPNVAGYFGPNTNEYDQEIYNIQRRAGQIKVRDLKEVGKEVQQLWGNLRFNQTKSLIERIYGTSPAASMANSFLEQQIQQDFPQWNRQLAYEEYSDRINRNMIEVFKAVNDPAVQALPAYPALRRYLNIREALSSSITQKYKLTNVDSWKTNKGGIFEREALKGVGDKLAAEDPAFEPLWNNVLSKEFRTLTPQEMRLAQAGQLP